jgi:deoxycytidylate deaminase
VSEFKDHTELFVALVAAVGTDQAMVIEELGTLLTSYDYTSETLRLSDYLAEQTEQAFRGRPLDEEIWDAMTAGDELRQEWDRNDALALHAISDVVAIREEKAGALDEAELAPNLKRHAFIMRSLKTPGELETLRSVYGSRLVVIGVYSPRDKRAKHLEERIKSSRKNADRKTWAHQAPELIERDEKEEMESGQDLRGTFHRADFFIRGWGREVVQHDLDRILELLFGSPFRTPTRDEHAQFLAAGAALRSSEFGRQVGAAIATPDGSVIAVGANEVPTAGGGSHWEEDGPGNRDFELGDMDTNRRNLNQLAEKVAEEIDAQFSGLFDEADKSDSAVKLQAAIRAELSEVLRTSSIKHLTEFGRSVHAEMNALLDAARRGVPVIGATLYTTTFPCHNCARHIVGAGIKRVVYIEPYPKSRAADLHEDAVRVDESMPPGEDDDRVVFEPFVGVAPRRYLDLFDAELRERLQRVRRKDDDGKKEKFVKEKAAPILSESGLADFIPEFGEYRAKELAALDYFLEHAGKE